MNIMMNRNKIFIQVMRVFIIRSFFKTKSSFTLCFKRNHKEKKTGSRPNSGDGEDREERVQEKKKSVVYTGGFVRSKLISFLSSIRSASVLVLTSSGLGRLGASRSTRGGGR